MNGCGKKEVKMKIGKKRKKKAFILILIFFSVCITLIYYLRAKTLGDLIIPEVTNSDEPTYCTFFDISRGYSLNWSEPCDDFFSPDNKLLWPLLNEVIVVGPIPYQNSSYDSELVNLYFALPNQNGDYCHVTVELMMNTADAHFSFLNIGNRGYVVLSGQSIIAQFISDARQYDTEKELYLQ